PVGSAGRRRPLGAGSAIHWARGHLCGDAHEDLLGKITYFLAHDEERAAIAAAGHRRTVAEHSYLNRVQQVVDLVESPSFKQAAPMRRANSIERGAARRDVYVHLHMVDAILDAAQASGSPPPARLRAVWPALVRRL